MSAMQTPDLVEAPSWSIRPELPVDIDQIHELHRAAFRGAAEAELVDAIRAGAGFIPALSLVAVAPDGSVLGHVLSLAPLAVLPPHWGRGIATALMRAALETADLRDEPFVAVLGPQSFYARFGFGPASDVEITSPYDAAGSAYQVRPLGEAALEPGTVVYPPMFGEL